MGQVECVDSVGRGEESIAELGRIAGVDVRIPWCIGDWRKNSENSIALRNRSNRIKGPWNSFGFARLAINVGAGAVRHLGL